MKNKDNNACNNNPCLSGGTCTATGSGATYECSCLSGYSGTNCDKCKIIIIDQLEINRISCNS